MPPCAALHRPCARSQASSGRAGWRCAAARSRCRSRCRVTRRTGGTDRRERHNSESWLRRESPPRQFVQRDPRCDRDNPEWSRQRRPAMPSRRRPRSNRIPSPADWSPAAPACTPRMAHPCFGSGPRSARAGNPRLRGPRTWRSCLCRWLRPTGSVRAPKWRRGLCTPARRAAARGSFSSIWPLLAFVPPWERALYARGGSFLPNFTHRADRGRLQRHPPTAMLFLNTGHGSGRRSTLRLPDAMNPSAGVEGGTKLITRFSGVRCLILLVALATASCAHRPSYGGRASGPDVLTFHRDAGRSGWDASEASLNSGRVADGTFGRLWASAQFDSSDGVPPRLYASPLYLDR